MTWFLRPAMILSFLLIVAITVGCAPKQPVIQLTAPAHIEAKAFFDLLQLQAEKTGATNAANMKIPGYPYLRMDRFWVEAGHFAETPAQQRLWFSQVRAMGLEGIEAEIERLPHHSVSEFSSGTNAISRAELKQMASIYAKQLAMQWDDAAIKQLRQNIMIPDEYETWRAWVGLYPVLYFPVQIGVDGWQQEIRDMGKTLPTLFEMQGGMAFTPPAVQAEPDVQLWLKRISNNALNIPLPDDSSQTGGVVAYFAPVWATVSREPYDKLGTPGAGAGEFREEPVVYTYFSHTYVGDRALLQINYVVWFSQRMPESWIDMTAGALDGLTFRVTLDDDGKPLFFDTMNNCGCYHMFFPVGGKVESAKVVNGVESAFVPHWLSGEKARQRIVVWYESAGHRTIKLDAITRRNQQGSVGRLQYSMRPYKTLEAGKLFDQHGLVPGSERAERIPFFGFGIPSVGIMRQRGHHATAFIGRRHFDDARLLERFFEFSLAKERPGRR